jgi:hypothetical protein
MRHLQRPSGQFATILIVDSSSENLPNPPGVSVRCGVEENVAFHLVRPFKFAYGN